MTKNQNKELISIDYADPKVIETIKATVAIGSTDTELAMFLELCKGTGLNPFKKEVWFIKSSGRVQIMTGLNGFLSIANSHPQYDGMEVDVDDDENPRKATCKVYRKDRKYPAVGVALMKEYKKGTPIWNQMPRVMLTKVAKSIALREAFPQELNGLYTVEEMPPEYAAPSTDLKPAVEVLPKEDSTKPKKVAVPLIPELQQKTIQMMKEQTAFEYDSEKLANLCGTEEQKKLVKNAAEREYGAVFDKSKKRAFTCKPVPEWHDFLLNDPVREEEDDLPESWGLKSDQSTAQ